MRYSGTFHLCRLLTSACLLLGCDQRSSVVPTTRTTDRPNQTLATRIELAIEQGDSKLAKSLIDSATSTSELTSAIDSDGGTLLQFATDVGNKTVVEALLNKKIDPDFALPPRRVTALHVACLLSETEIVKLLLSRGANPNVADSRGDTPLHHAASAGNLEIIRALIAKGAAINASNGVSRPIFEAMRLSPSQNTNEVIDYLLEQGPDLSAIEGGHPLLWHAVNSRNFHAVEAVLKHGGKVDQRLPNGTTEIVHAASQDDWNIVRLLMRHGANINAQDAVGKTPLHYAAWTVEAEMVKELLEAGSRPDIRDRRNMVPADYVKHSGSSDESQRAVLNLLAAKQSERTQ